MKAILVRQYGGPEVLKVEEVSIESPGPGQVLVRIAAVGINFVDIYIRRGNYDRPGKLPYTPGKEGAGIVEEVGEGVKGFKAGDRVCFIHDAPTYAEMALVRADKLIPLPKEFSFEFGAAFPLQGMTAHYLLHEFRLVKRGDIVLIHAAAGGMGLLLVQWAKHLGAHVIGTVSTDAKAKMAMDAGANDVVLYTKQDFVKEVHRITNGKGADLIIDGVGKTTFIKNLDAASLKGHIVCFGFASGSPDPVEPGSLVVKSLSVSGGTLGNFIITRKELIDRANAVIDGVQNGWLKLKIDRVLPLEKAAEAHRLLEERKTSGKLLLSTGFIP